MYLDRGFMLVLAAVKDLYSHTSRGYLNNG